MYALLYYSTLSTNSLSYLLLVISSVRVAHSASLNMGQAIKFNLLHTFSSPLFATVHPLLLLRLASSQPPADPVIVYCLLLCNKENAFDLHHNSCLLTLKTESPLTPCSSSSSSTTCRCVRGNLLNVLTVCPDSSAWYTHTYTQQSAAVLGDCQAAYLRPSRITIITKTDERSPL